MVQVVLCTWIPTRSSEIAIHTPLRKYQSQSSKASNPARFPPSSDGHTLCAWSRCCESDRLYGFAVRVRVIPSCPWQADSHKAWQQRRRTGFVVDWNQQRNEQRPEQQTLHRRRQSYLFVFLFEMLADWAMLRSIWHGLQRLPESMHWHEPRRRVLCKWRNRQLNAPHLEYKELHWPCVPGRSMHQIELLSYHC